MDRPGGRKDQTGQYGTWGLAAGMGNPDDIKESVLTELFEVSVR